MKIYVAGPYSTGNVSTNVKAAVLAGDELAGRGHIVFIPHLTFFWGMLCPHENEFWMQQDFGWVRACDALLRLPGESPGADREVALAESLGKLVYNSTEEVPLASACPRLE